MEHKELMEEIIRKGEQSGMEVLGEIFDSSMDYLEEHDKEEYEKLRLCLYEEAYGEELTEEMSREWVKTMQPVGEHWIKQQTDEVLNTRNIKVNTIEFYTAMNMIYNDYYDIVKDDTELAVKLSLDWLKDIDANEHKLYKYWKYISK